MGLLRWNKAFALEQAADDAELLQELLDIFKTSFASDLDLIQEGLGANDAGQIANAAHSIKGAASSLGIDGLTELVKEIEIDCKGGSVARARDEITTLKNMLDEINAL